jgi:hypothetical protein
MWTEQEADYTGNKASADMSSSSVNRGARQWNSEQECL